MGEGRFKRAIRRMTADVEDLEAEDIQELVAERGAVPIAECPERQPATVVGTVQSVTLRPRAGVPALEAELYDGTQSLFVVWLGRRQIAGIAPGVLMSAHGRVGLNQGRRTMFNPAYEILPRAGS